ncbi:MAG: molybdopterin-dependent oxidoreductase [Pseudomonadota bacterium]
MQQIIKTTCPRDCYDTCGIVVSPRAGGRARVGGDPEHAIARGALCAKCGVAYNGVFQDAAVRLLSPLRRTGPKGSGKFEPVGWDEALDEIAGRLNGIVAEHGASSILTMNYSGTMSLLASAFPNRFVNAIGASVVDYGTICNRAGYLAWELLFGTGRRGFDPRTARDAGCILLWGANPAHSAPHAFEHWLGESPAKCIVIDPLRTRTAAGAELHLMPRPGSDAALAFALLHALDELGAFDEEFIAAHTAGADEIRADIARCTPEWAAPVTGVPAERIRAAAELYAAGPSLLWCGQGLQRQPQGGNVMRAAGLLPAMTGNIGKPGAGFYYINDVAELAGIDSDYLEGEELRKAPAKTVGALELADRLSCVEESAVRESAAHKSAVNEFKAFVVWNTNPLASSADLGKLRAACRRDDLYTVCIDLFLTDTARYADLVLPAASFLEFDDITAGYFNLNLGVQSKALEPPGESLPNQSIFRRLARAMDLDEAALFEDDSSILARVLGQLGYSGSFDDFRKDGTFWLNGDEPLILFADLQFATPSGHIEIASARAEALGLPRCPQPGADAPPAKGRFRLLSPASEWRLNDSYANDPRLGRRSGAAELTLHPDDAAGLGIESGAKLKLANEMGEVVLTALVSRDVLPGTVMSYKGRWPSREAGGDSINVLYDGSPNDMAGSSSVHGVQVTVSPLRA